MGGDAAPGRRPAAWGAAHGVGGADVAVPLEPAPGNAWVGTLPLAAGLPPGGLLTASAADAQGRTALAATSILLAGATPDDDLTLYAPDSGASLLLPAGSLAGAGSILLQATRLPAAPPAGLDLIAGPYALRLSPTLAPASGAEASLSLHYTGMGAAGSWPAPRSLRAYAWTGSAWQPLESVLLEAGARVAAPVPVAAGVYALFGTWQGPVLLPIVVR